MTPKLSKCAEEYFDAVLNPFDTTLRPCLPMEPAVASKRSCVWARGTMAVGTTGIGGIWTTAAYANNTSAGAHNNCFAAYSTSLYTGLNCVAAVSTTGIGASQPNSDYSELDLDVDAAQIRLVSIGIRIRYIGKEVDRGGNIIIWRSNNPVADPTNAYFMAPSEMLKYENTQILPVDREWHSVTYTPGNPSEYAFGGTKGYHWSATAGNNYILAAIGINGGTPGTSFQFEVTGHYEVIGPDIRDKFPTLAAPMEASHIQSFLGWLPLDGLADYAGKAQRLYQVLSNAADRGIGTKSVLDAVSAMAASTVASAFQRGARHKQLQITSL